MANTAQQEESELIEIMINTYLHAEAYLEHFKKSGELLICSVKKPEIEGSLADVIPQEVAQILELNQISSEAKDKYQKYKQKVMLNAN